MIGKFQILNAAAVALALFCCGCSARLSQGALVPVAQANTVGTSLVPILIATKRTRSTTDPGEMFDSGLAEQTSYASVTVSMPPDAVRKIGDVQWPATLPGDPQQSFVTVSANYLDKQSFGAALSTAAKKSGRGKVLLFVHGFNNRFDEAVYRFAQIIHDSKAPAVPVLFSWPSRGVVGLRAYQDDLENATGSREALEEALDGIAANANVKEVTIVCHSMGCFLTLEALHSKALRTGKIGSKVKNVLLVAPDVNINLFRTQMREMGSARPRFALFLSQDDHALKLSRSIGGGDARLGDVHPDEEPYKSDFQRERIVVFELTSLGGGAHSRAFEKVTSVMGLIEERLAQGQVMTDDGPAPEATGPGQ
ncbi:MAG: alpha/beta fold hydrolase [Bradyrhizobium sp.]